MVEPYAYTVSEAAEVSGVSRSTLYRAMGAGKLEARKCGRTTLIFADELKRWLEALPIANDR